MNHKAFCAIIVFVSACSKDVSNNGSTTTSVKRRASPPVVLPAAKPSHALQTQKSRWLSLMQQPSPHSKDEICALFERSALELGCTDDLVELVLFLESSQEWMANNITFSSDIDSILAKLFSSHQGDMLRSQLIALTNRQFRLRWAYAAAVGCSTPESYATLEAGLGQEDADAFAKHGYLNALVVKNPELALSELLKLNKHLADIKQTSPYSLTSLGELVSKLPPNTNFKLVISMLSEGDTRRLSNYDRIIAGVFSQWGASNPSEAISYIFSSPKALPSTALAAALDSYLHQSPSDAIEYLQELPSGAQYDRAIVHVIEYLQGKSYGKYLPECLALARQIEDLKLREQQVARLSAQRRPSP